MKEGASKPSLKFKCQMLRLSRKVCLIFSGHPVDDGLPEIPIKLIEASSTSVGPAASREWGQRGVRRRCSAIVASYTALDEKCFTSPSRHFTDESQTSEHFLPRNPVFPGLMKNAP